MSRESKRHRRRGGDQGENGEAISPEAWRLLPVVLLNESGDAENGAKSMKSRTRAYRIERRGGIEGIMLRLTVIAPSVPPAAATMKPRHSGGDGRARPGRNVPRNESENRRQLAADMCASWRRLIAGVAARRYRAVA